METNDKPAKDTAIVLGGPVPDSADIQRLADPVLMTEMLHRFQRFTDEAFEELVHDTGYRAALLVLRAKALRGDVKALELYIRLAKDSKREREAKKDRPTTRDVTPAAFVPKDRASSTKD